MLLLSALLSAFLMLEPNANSKAGNPQVEVTTSLDAAAQAQDQEETDLIQKQAKDSWARLMPRQAQRRPALQRSPLNSQWPQTARYRRCRLLMFQGT